MLKIIFSFFLMVVVLMWPVTAAQAALVPCSGLNCNVSHFFQLLVNIYDFLLGLAALVAILLIIWSGIKMLTYQFSENPESDLTEAKHTLTRALTGLALIVGAFLVVRTLLLVLGVTSGFFSGITDIGNLLP